MSETRDLYTPNPTLDPADALDAAAPPSDATEDGIAPVVVPAARPMTPPPPVVPSSSSSTPSLHHYEIGEQLGQGGNATVYRAVDTRSGAVVAIKRIHKKLIDDPKFFGRFAREVRAASTLVHPNICRLFETGETDGDLWLAMELIEGGSLADLLDRQHTLPAQVAAVLMDQLLAAIGVAHQARILHRDIKPQNIMLTTDGVLKLVDFGIARGEGDAKVTETGLLVGTPAYMSPEQVTGRPIDHRSDLYAAGLVLYEMLAGENPYTRHAPSTAMLKIATEPLPPLVDFDHTAVAALDRLATGLLMRDPARRPSNADEARRELTGLLSWVHQRDPQVVGNYLADPVHRRQQLRGELASLHRHHAQAFLEVGVRGRPAAILALARAEALEPSTSTAAQLTSLCQQDGIHLGGPSPRVQAALDDAEAAPGNATLWKRLADVARAEGHLHLMARGLRRWLADRADEQAALQLRQLLLADGTGPRQLAGLETRDLVPLSSTTREREGPSSASPAAEAFPRGSSSPAPSSPQTRTAAPRSLAEGDAARSLRPTTPATLDRPRFQPPVVEPEAGNGRAITLGLLSVLAAVGVFLFITRFTRDEIDHTQRVLSENVAHVGRIEENDVSRQQENRILDARTALARREANTVVTIVTELLDEPTLPGAFRREGHWLRAQAYELLQERFAARRDYTTFLDLAPVTDPHYVDAKRSIERLGMR